MACKLVYDKGTRKYEIHIPLKRQQKWATDTTGATAGATGVTGTAATYSENQGYAKVIALDPGVWTFLTGYSPDGTLTEFTSGDAARLCKLAATADKLCARLDNVDVRHHERQRLKRKRLSPYTFKDQQSGF